MRANSDLEDAFVGVMRAASRVLTRGKVLVAEDDGGSHHAVALEVPIEVIRALAASVEEARALLRSDVRDAA